MADIQIDDPITFLIDIQEFDENLHSLKLKCILKEAESVKGNFKIEFNFWVLCKDFDLFVDEQITQLIDLSGITRLVFENDNIAIIPSFKNKEFSFQCKIEFKSNEELKQNLRDKFKAFPKWW